jgi:hypothetical protein
MKPVEVDAIRFDGENYTEALRMLDEDSWTVRADISSHCLLVNTLDGTQRCVAGDWLIRDAQGHCHAVPDDAFRQAYEAA